MSKEYTEKLKDPRWQKKRLQILERDDWTCQICDATESTLVVHHKKYLPNTDPWDYPGNLLITLCQDCHEYETGERPMIERELLDVLRLQFFTVDLIDIRQGFEGLIKLHQDGVVSLAYKRALLSPEIQRDLIKGYFEAERV